MPLLDEAVGEVSPTPQGAGQGCLDGFGADHPAIVRPAARAVPRNGAAAVVRYVRSMYAMICDLPDLGLWVISEWGRIVK